MLRYSLTDFIIIEDETGVKLIIIIINYQCPVIYRYGWRTHQ